MKSTLVICLLSVVVVSGYHFEDRHITRLRRSLANVHARAKRHLMNSTMGPKDGDFGEYETEYFAYGSVDYYNPFDEAVYNSFRQHLMAYPKGKDHIVCVEECKPFLTEIDKYDSGEESENDPFELLFGNNPSGDINGEDFTINISGDLPAFYDILGNGSEKFDEARFNSMCSAYKQSVDCIYNCPYGFFTRLVNSVFRPIEYMCDVAKEEYLKYVTCAETVSLKSCKEQCSYSAINKTATSLRDGITILSDMCGYMTCQSDCGAPQIKKACNDAQEASDVFQQTVNQIVAAVVDLSQLLGFAPGPVGKCVSVIANTTSLPSEVNLKPPLDLFLLPRPLPRKSPIAIKTEALTLELLTLNVVKAQKELLNLDLKNAFLANQLKEQAECPKQCSDFSK